MKNNPHWTDDFFGSLYVRFDQLRHNNADAEAEGIIRLCQLSNNDQIVELCCGYGRLLIPLAKRTSIPVTGIDKSKALLEVAHKSAQTAGVEIDLIKADILNYRKKKHFDVAYIAGSAFGYYEDIEQNGKVLVTARSLLRYGSIFLLEQTYHPNNLHVKENDGEYRFEKNATFNSKSGAYNGTYSYEHLESGERITHHYKSWLYRREVLLQLLSRSGFTHFQCFGNYRGKPFVEDDQRLIVVCRAE
jgi:SAM-dependent methyltransferase